MLFFNHELDCIEITKNGLTVAEIKSISYMNDIWRFWLLSFTVQVSFYTLQYWSLRQCRYRKEVLPWTSVFELRLPTMFISLKVNK